LSRPARRTLRPPIRRSIAQLAGTPNLAAMSLALPFMQRAPLASARPLRAVPGASATLWTMEDIAQRIEANASKAGRRGPYNKRGA
jgi:hypothetical protein